MPLFLYLIFMLKNALLVFAGGGIGSVARYLVGYFVNLKFPVTFPLGTFQINIFGSLLIGLILGYFKQKGIESSAEKLFLTVGICGGFTTFSSFSAENIQLLQNGNLTTAFMYIALSVLLGLGATYVGLWLVK